MRKGFLGSLAVLAAGAGLTFGQPYPPPQGMPGPLPGTLPPPGQTTGNPPPGVAPYAYSGPSGANAGYQYASPDGHPLIMPPGLEGMVPPGSMGAGAPGGAYDWPNVSPAPAARTASEPRNPLRMSPTPWSAGAGAWRPVRHRPRRRLLAPPSLDRHVEPGP